MPRGGCASSPAPLRHALASRSPTRRSAFHINSRSGRSRQCQGGADTIDNAIAVCFECHAEIHLYNPHHPKGRRFTPEELRHHRDQWLEICRTRPEALTDPARAPNPGYVERLIHELDFDARVAGELHPERM